MRTDHVPRQTTIFDETVSSRIEALLARCDRIRRGSEINRPVYFGARGEQHANRVAARDRQPERRSS